MKRLKDIRRTDLIRILIVSVGVITAVILVILISQKITDSLPMPMKYTNQQMVYASGDQSDMQTGTSFARNLCVASDDISNSNVTLDGSSESAALFSLDDRQVLFSKGLYKKIYPASITKIMTAIVALKYGNMNDTVTINWQDLELESGSQVVGFKIGDKVKMSDLMHGLLVHSGNDCAQAIARHVGGSMSKFVEMMNEELNAIGCTGSHFTNPTGLQDTDHYTTVYDIYLMLNEALTYEDFTTIMQVAVYDLQYEDAQGNEKHVTLDSTDHYLTGETDPPKNVTVLGGKTGTTSEAGNCLVIETQNAYGQPYISVVVGARSKTALYEDMNSLLSQINS
jgi:D-alanyl-D-alanine carboxypeptidase